jgi:type IV pilus assembly protein PilE
MRQGEQMTRQTDNMGRGFTLIELMVTVAIVAILTTIAYPLYLHQLVEGRRSAAEATLMDIAQREQQYILDQRQYAGGADASAVSTNLNVTIPSNVTQFYSVSVNATAGPPPGFTATATPIAGTAQASDVTLTIDQTGSKQPTGIW